MRKTVLVGAAIGLVCIGVLLGAFLTVQLEPALNLHGRIGINLETYSIHARIRIWKADELILDEYHSGALTNIGDNQTLFWIFGEANMQEDGYISNCTYISIGNQGTLNTASTQLPGEWNRTSASFEDYQQSQLNMTCTFYPDAGPYTADCIGINWASSGDGNLWGYDTFSEVTGIDNTFTINVEFQISVSHA